MYGTKTAQDCLDVVADLRQQLAAASAIATADSIASKVNEIAYWEGRVRAHSEYESCATPVDRLTRLAEILSAPIEDTKSGRLNDVERSRFDGLRDAARHLVTKASIAAEEN